MYACVWYFCPHLFAVLVGKWRAVNRVEYFLKRTHLFHTYLPLKGLILVHGPTVINITHATLSTVLSLTPCRGVEIASQHFPNWNFRFCAPVLYRHMYIPDGSRWAGVLFVHSWLRGTYICPWRNISIHRSIPHTQAPQWLCGHTSLSATPVSLWPVNTGCILSVVC